MIYIVLRILRERRPMLYYFCSAVLFVLSQLDYFLLNKVICRVSLISYVASFLTLMEMESFVQLYFPPFFSATIPY